MRVLILGLAALFVACVPAPTPHVRSPRDAGVAPVDAGPPPVEHTCDPVSQHGCTGLEACVWSVDDDSALCQVTTSSASLGDPCDAERPSCLAGHTCTALRNDEETTCYAVCDPAMNVGCEELTTAERSYVCLPLADLSYGLCVLTGSTCDPLHPGTCASDEACTLFGGQTSCVKAGTIEKGGTCASAPCARGLLCVKLSDRPAAVCLEPCDTGSPICPGSHDVCTGLEGLGFGVCQASNAECSPLADNCGADRACGLHGTSVTCLTPGDVELGGDCSTRACQRGGVCARMLREPHPSCRQPCDLGLPRCTSPTEECSDIGLAFGVCL